jgi:hypothetical protein
MLAAKARAPGTALESSVFSTLVLARVCCIWFFHWRVLRGTYIFLSTLLSRLIIHLCHTISLFLCIRKKHLGIFARATYLGENALRWQLIFESISILFHMQSRVSCDAMQNIMRVCLFFMANLYFQTIKSALLFYSLQMPPWAYQCLVCITKM